jgi:hypothetical protein
MLEKADMQRTLLPGSRATYEESLDIEILLVKTNLCNVSVTVIKKKKLNDARKFVAKMEFLLPTPISCQQSIPVSILCQLARYTFTYFR